jgi:hypothetical protein
MIWKRKYNTKQLSINSQRYIKKHQNKTIEDYGFTKKQILNDFDFVYQEYFV